MTMTRHIAALLLTLVAKAVFADPCEQGDIFEKLDCQLRVTRKRIKSLERDREGYPLVRVVGVVFHQYDSPARFQQRRPEAKGRRLLLPVDVMQ